MCIEEYVLLENKVKEWGVSRANLYRFIQRGKLPEAVKSGNQWYLPRDCKKPPDMRYKRNKGIVI